MRPVLSTAARRLWRDQETLQIGRTPGRAVVLAGLDAQVRPLLALLDGTRDRDQVLHDAVTRGVPADRAATLLELLERAGALLDAAQDTSALAGLARGERDRLGADLGALAVHEPQAALASVARRRRASVLLYGGGRVGAAVAALLAAAGVGAVDVHDEGAVRPEDCGAGALPLSAVGSKRGDAVRALLAQTSPSVQTGVQLPDLVLLTPAAGRPLPEAPMLVPHLVAEIRERTAVVGPLVLPGASACLHCLDLARTDIDPDWPAVAAQLSDPVRGVAPCDGPLAAAAASQAVLQALTYLDGGSPPATVGGTLELSLPDWRWRRRTWQRHPACHCQSRLAG